MDVDFNHVGTALYAFFDGKQRVFGGKLSAAAVRNNLFAGKHLGCVATLVEKH